MKLIRIGILFLTVCSLHAGTYRYLEDPLLGMQNVSNLVTADTFVPVSFFVPGELQLNGLGVMYNADVLRYDDGGTGSDVEGDDLGGFGMSLFLSYSLTDTSAVFGMFSKITMSGDADFSYVNGFPSYHGLFDISKSSVTSVMGGYSYDVLERTKDKRISLPLYAILSCRFHDEYMEYTDTGGEFFTIEDNNMYWTLLLGGGFSYRFKNGFQITPFVLIGIMTETNPHITRAVPSEEYDIDLDEGMILHGVEFSYRNDSNFSISFSVDGLYNRLNPISQEILHGLELSSYSVSLGYFF